MACALKFFMMSGGKVVRGRAVSADRCESGERRTADRCESGERRTADGAILSSASSTTPPPQHRSPHPPDAATPYWEGRQAGRQVQETYVPRNSL